VVHSAFEDAGEFSCSNELLNRVQACTRWSYIGNFTGIPTDCPHREKNGWTGDALLATETGLFNYRAAPAYLKWLNDIADAQRPSGQLPGIVPSGGWGYNWGSGPAWDSAFTLIPWFLYLYNGDRRGVVEHYGGMKRYVDFLATLATDDIVSFGLGDWCPPVGGVDGHKTPAALTSTAYYYVNCRMLARFGELLGKGADARRYHRQAVRIARAFNKRFYDPGTGVYAGNGQTSMACALYQGLAEKTEQGKVLTALMAAIEANEGRLDYGILGAKYVPNALTEAGRSEVAFRMATQMEFPGYGHWIERGATTLWEAWDGTGSRNHVMFGDISAWMFKALAGINPDPDKPGFQHIIVRPSLVPGLSWVRAAHRAMQGWIRVEWKAEKDRFVLEIAVPANTTATVHLPASEAGKVTESGRPLAETEGITGVGMETGCPLVHIGSGRYRFEGTRG
jgi:alpha-L-rhamnosidase